MFSIIVNGLKLDSSGMSVNLYLKSTFPFSPDQGHIEGSFAFNGRLPSSPLNKRIFGFPVRLEGSFDLPIDLPCQLSINGRIWYDGMISITSATIEWLNFDLLIGFGYYASLIKDKTLKDLSFPEPLTIGANTQQICEFASECIIRSYPAVKFNFPTIYAPNFYGEENDINPSYSGFINMYSSSSGFIQNFANATGTHNLNTLVPMLYISYITKLCFETFGYQAAGAFFNDPEISKILLYNNFALDKTKRIFYVQASGEGPQTYTFLGGEETIMFDDDSSGDNEDEEDCFDTTTSEYTVQSEGDYYIQFSTQVYNPFPAVNLVFRFRLYKNNNILEEVDFLVTQRQTWVDFECFFGHFLYSEDVGSKLTIRFYCLTTDLMPANEGSVQNSLVTFENITLGKLNIFNPVIDYPNHLPDKEISSFLIDLQILFGIVIGFDHDKKRAEISFVKDLLKQLEADDLSLFTQKSSVKVTLEKPKGYTIQYDWDSSDETTDLILEPSSMESFIGEFDKFSDLPYPSKLENIAYVRNTNSYYIFNVVDGPGPYWNLLSHHHSPLTVGDGANEVKSSTSPLMMIRHPTSRSIYPYILQQGTSLAFEDTINEFNSRIMLFHGLQPSFLDPSQNYPFASSHSMDSLGNSVGSLDLSIEGDKGLFENYLTEYYTWLTELSKQVTYRTWISYSQLKALDLLRIHRIFNSRFLVKEAKISVSNNKMANVELDCRKV